jgi:hypothetical protein
MIKQLPTLSVLTLAFLFSACSSTPKSAAPAAAPAPTAAASNAPAAPTRTVKSRDGKYTGEIVGTPAPDSKFAKLEIGMEVSEIEKVMGRGPDRSHSYESGKRWIPFYFGNDARRMQALYKGEGCLILTGGNIWGGGGGDLLQIVHDPSGACYQP